MESIVELHETERALALKAWLLTVVNDPITSLVSMPGDASFRRYFRLKTAPGSWVVMDAPPPENCGAFILVAKALQAKGLRAPTIFAADEKQGFLLLTDFGDATYLKTLSAQNADMLYHHALDALAVFQTIDHVPGKTLPVFTAAFMQQEWAWHKEWFLNNCLTLTPPAHLDKTFELIAKATAAQPHVFMYRDFHSANLMWLADEVSDQKIGLLDFQDAFIGPITYDLVSLLRDCYIDWPAERVKTWIMSYWQRLQASGQCLHVSADEFLQWTDWMGIERHLKALFTFARKAVRDQQPRYLQFVPRTLQYIINISALYPELAALHDYYQTIVQPAFNQWRPACAV